MRWLEKGSSSKKNHSYSRPSRYVHGPRLWNPCSFHHWHINHLPLLTLYRDYFHCFLDLIVLCPLRVAWPQWKLVQNVVHVLKMWPALIASFIILELRGGCWKSFFIVPLLPRLKLYSAILDDQLEPKHAPFFYEPHSEETTYLQKRWLWLMTMSYSPYLNCLAQVV